MHAALVNTNQIKPSMPLDVATWINWMIPAVIGFALGSISVRIAHRYQRKREQLVQEREEAIRRKQTKHLADLMMAQFKQRMARLEQLAAPEGNSERLSFQQKRSKWKLEQAKMLAELRSRVPSQTRTEPSEVEDILGTEKHADN